MAPAASTSAIGTTVPMMPPIRVKNWISPAISIFSAAGSPAASLLFSAWDGPPHAPVGVPADRLPHGDEILVERARVRLIVILDEREVGGLRLF